MKVQRFIGSTSGETLDHVRNALGPNAMILSNRSIEEGKGASVCRRAHWPARYPINHSARLHR
jgi:flagellar biosynthesis GTPase FlhF